MINNTAHSVSTPLGPQTPTNQKHTPSFGRIKHSSTGDGFISSENKKSKLQIAMMAITTASVAALALTRARLGKVLKTVGEDVPLTVANRLKKVANVTAKDGMTGLFNKKALITDMSKEYTKAIKSGEHLSVAMLDMDNFKGVNEIFDHATGDVVLKRIASNIQEVADKHGIKGFRYGGEEFVIAMPGKNPEEARKITNEIANKIKSDDVIQGYLPKFMDKAQKDMKFFDSTLQELNYVFGELRYDYKTQEIGLTNKKAIDIIENHIKKCKPADTENLKEILTLLKKEPPEKLSINSKIGKDSSVGNELDKIYKQYKANLNDLEKWTGHVNRHKLFTMSGGVADLSDAKELKDGVSIVKLADTALKGAKENGKNQIIIANNEMIQKTIEKLNS